MGHVRVRVQTGEHHNASDDDLSQNSNHQTPRKPHQIFSERPTKVGQQHRCNHTERYNTSEQPVGLLYQGVASRHVHKFRCVTTRPVCTAEAGTCQAHHCARKYDDGQGAQSGSSDSSESFLGDRNHTPHCTTALAKVSVWRHEINSGYGHRHDHIL